MEKLLSNLDVKKNIDIPDRAPDIRIRTGDIWLKEKILLFGGKGQPTLLDSHKTYQIDWDEDGSHLRWITDRVQWIEFKPHIQKDFQHGLAEHILLGDYTDSNI